MFQRTPSIPSACGVCGKAPSSIVLYKHAPTSAAGAFLCKACCGRWANLEDAPFRALVDDAIEHKHSIGGLPPSISSSLWAGKVPHLRAFALRAAQTSFASTNGKFFRERMPKYLQDRVLKGVYAENPDLSPRFRKAFEELAVSHTKLTLTLTEFRLSNKEAAFLSVFLQCGNQVALDLSFNRLGKAAVTVLVPHFAAHPTLHTANLSYSRLGDDGITLLTQALSRNCVLTQLDLASAGFRLHGCSQLSRLLLVNTTLRKLNLSFNNLQMEGAEVLGPGIAGNLGLTHLNLRHNAFGPGGALFLADALLANDGRITCLNVADNSIGEEGAAALATKWRTAGVLAVLQAVVPGFPDPALFVHSDVGDKAVVKEYGFSRMADFKPGRLTGIL